MIPLLLSVFNEFRPEACSWQTTLPPYICRSGRTIKGEIISEESTEIDSISNRCSPCNPDPSETQWCWESGGQYDWTSCNCGASPVVIDVLGNGFNLTSVTNGILFDITGDSQREQVAWTATDSDEAWLALDRNVNGKIDSGRELFGNNTPQPDPPSGEEKNGFLALAKYDKPGQGGNNDGQISQQDAIFNDLRLWQDANHNGISEAGELKTLPAPGLRKIDLDYKESRRVDENGNRFKYRAKVKDAQDAQLGRWAWDVYLVVQQP